MEKEQRIYKNRATFPGILNGRYESGIYGPQIRGLLRASTEGAVGVFFFGFLSPDFKV